MVPLCFGCSAGIQRKCFFLPLLAFEPYEPFLKSINSLPYAQKRDKLLPCYFPSLLPATIILSCHLPHLHQNSIKNPPKITRINPENFPKTLSYCETKSISYFNWVLNPPNTHSFSIICKLKFKGCTFKRNFKVIRKLDHEGSSSNIHPSTTYWKCDLRGTKSVFIKNYKISLILNNLGAQVMCKLGCPGSKFSSFFYFK